MTEEEDIPIPTELLILVLEHLWLSLCYDFDTYKAVSEIYPVALVRRRWAPIVLNLMWSELIIETQSELVWLSEQDEIQFRSTTSLMISFEWTTSTLIDRLISKLNNVERIKLSKPALDSPLVSNLIDLSGVKTMKSLTLYTGNVSRWIQVDSLHQLEKLELIDVDDVHPIKFENLHLLRHLRISIRSQNLLVPLVFGSNLTSLSYRGFGGSKGAHANKNLFEGIKTASSSLKELRLWIDITVAEVGTSVLPTLPNLERLTFENCTWDLSKAPDFFSIAPNLKRSLQLKELIVNTFILDLYDLDRDLSKLEHASWKYCRFVSKSKYDNVQQNYYWNHKNLLALQLDWHDLGTPSVHYDISIMFSSRLLILNITGGKTWDFAMSAEALNMCRSLKFLSIQFLDRSSSLDLSRLCIPLEYLILTSPQHHISKILKNMWIAIQLGGLKKLKRLRIKASVFLTWEDTEEWPNGLKEWMERYDVQIDSSTTWPPQVLFERWSRVVVLNNPSFFPADFHSF